MKNRLKILTVVTNKNEEGLIHLLEPSCAFFNLNLIVLETDHHNYNSHKCKDLMLSNFIEKETTEDEIILFTDGYDAMFMCREDEILSKYDEMGKKIIFSAEINCWPDSSLSNRYPESQSPFKYLCSGGFIGRAGWIRKKIEEKIETASIQKFSYSNQIYWTEQFLKDQENIGLDNECRIFVALSSEIDMFFIRQQQSDENFDKYLKQKVNWFNKNFSFKKNRIYNRITKTKPCHVHANGLSKLISKEIADTLNFVQPVK